jgi:hypothetical protein
MILSSGEFIAHVEKCTVILHKDPGVLSSTRIKHRDPLAELCGTFRKFKQSILFPVINFSF